MTRATAVAWPREARSARPGRPGRPTLRLVLRTALAVAVVAGLATAAPRWGADLTAVLPTVAGLGWREGAALAVASAVNIVTYWFLMVAALPGLRLGQAALANQASTAVSSTVAGGGAVAAGVTFAMYRSFGFTTREFALSSLASGAWTVVVKLAVPVVAIVPLTLAGEDHPVLAASARIGAAAALVGAAGAVLLLRDARLARRVGEWCARTAAALRPRRRAALAGWGDAAVAARADALVLLRDRWRPLTLAAVVSHASLFAVLVVSLRLVGVGEGQLGWPQVLAAFAFVELLSAVPITPGAVGVAELGYAATLTAGLAPDVGGRVAAAVLLYRAVTYLPPILIGAVCLWWWRRRTAAAAG